MINKKICLLLVSSAFSILANAADVYVRPGATGANNGSDWANAYTTLPATLKRGDTYYLADGTYGAYTFRDAGTTMITIKKATVLDHGTSLGWDASFGDGEALFTSAGTVWTFKPGVGYYQILGQKGSGNTAGSYGIRLKSSSSRNSATALVAPDLGGLYDSTGGNSNIHIDRVEFDWNNGTAAGSAGATRAIQWNTALDNTNIKVSNCFIHHSSGFGIYAASMGTGFTVDGCFFEKNGGASVSHHETLWVTGAKGFVFKNNTIKDTVNGALTGWLMLGAVSGADIYNNVFTCSSPTACATGGNGIIATWDNNVYANSNINIYNNTFANLPTTGNPAIYFYHSGGAKDSNVQVLNNIFYTGSFSVVGATVNGYAACGGGVACPGTNPQTNLSTAIFKSWSNQDFQLNQPTAAGTTTSFTTDRLGLVRGGDGVWDRGAFEFTTGAVAIAPPTNLKVQ